MKLNLNIFKKKKPIKEYDCVCEWVRAEQIKHPDKLITGFCGKHKTDWV
jgi:hypothetical protein